jgi:hypothetical protein
MSGGAWGYQNSSLADELFGYRLDCTYGEKGREQSVIARKINPMDDREVSELVWDVLCLITSRDYFVSGDNCEETYMKDLQAFKDKWFKRTDDDKVASYKQDLFDYCQELMAEMNGSVE